MHRSDDPTATSTDREPQPKRRTGRIVAAVVLLAALGAVLHLTGVLPPG